MEMAARLRKVKIIILLFFLLLCSGCNSKTKFKVYTDITGKKIYQTIDSLYYVLNNGNKETILITKDEVPCTILDAKINNEGIIAFAIYVFEGKNISEDLFGDFWIDSVKTKYYLLFISNNKELKYKNVPTKIKEMQWINNAKIKIIYKDIDGEKKIEYIKNPFTNK